MADTDVIGEFHSGTTCESLVHRLGRKGPRTTKELLDITTNHASGEEAVGAVFERNQHAAKEKRCDRDRPSSSCEDRKSKKNHRPPATGEVAVPECQDKRPSRNDHFS